MGDDISLNAISDEQQPTTSVVEDDREHSLSGGGSLDASSLGQGGKSNIFPPTRATPPSRLAAPKAHFGMMEGEEKIGIDQSTSIIPLNVPNFLPQRKFVQVSEILIFKKYIILLIYYHFYRLKKSEREQHVLHLFLRTADQALFLMLL